MLQEKESSSEKTEDEDEKLEEEEVKEPQAVSHDEILVFKESCSNCQMPAETRMKVVGETENDYFIIMYM